MFAVEWCRLHNLCGFENSRLLFLSRICMERTSECYFHFSQFVLTVDNAFKSLRVSRAKHKLKNLRKFLLFVIFGLCKFQFVIKELTIDKRRDFLKCRMFKMFLLCALKNFPTFRGSGIFDQTYDERFVKKIWFDRTVNKTLFFYSKQILLKSIGIMTKNAFVTYTKKSYIL